MQTAEQQKINIDNNICIYLHDIYWQQPMSRQRLTGFPSGFRKHLGQLQLRSQEVTNRLLVMFGSAVTYLGTVTKILFSQRSKPSGRLFSAM